ncbi:TPA: hypothetical protein HA259_00895 [Thermoplasmata archaeon]|nr:hypothetical protein [Thermoplasmata archaeon]
MPFSSKVLEDSIRLAKIRRIKWALYVVQIIMLVVLAFVMIFIFGDAQMKPVLYLPLDSFAAVMVLLILVVCVESFFFRMMEIRFARSSSAKHLMAKNSIRYAIFVAVIAGFVTVIFMTPPILDMVEESSSKTSILTEDEPMVFWSRDPLALQRMVEVQATASETVEIYLVAGEPPADYNSSLASQMFLLRINRNDYIVDGTLTIEVPRTDHDQYTLVLNGYGDSDSVATVTIVRDTSELFTGIVSVLALAITVANIAWVAYLTPIERKYSRGSIYK